MVLTADLFATTISWRHEAKCKDADLSLFFPVGTTGPAVAQIAEAKRVCFQCSCRAACLEFALTTNQDGIWGGSSEEERRAMRRHRRLKRAQGLADGEHLSDFADMADMADHTAYAGSADSADYADVVDLAGYDD